MSLKYEKPVLIQFNSDGDEIGLGLTCSFGSGFDGGNCIPGGSAGGKCQANGSAAGAKCQTFGTLPNQ